jgi:hypothetical protein
MTHNARCAYAKSSQCRCSCGGSLHGSGFSRSRRIARKLRRKSKSSTLLGSTAKSLVIGASIGATATVFPAIVPIYKAYSIAKIGKELYDTYTESKNKNETFDKLMTEATKYSTSEASKKLSENDASQIAKGIRLTAESVGLISQISQESKIDENVYGSMLEGSVKNGMLSGIGNLTSYTVEGLTS